MSRIDELIARLCPDGVEYKPLGELLNYEQPGKYIVHDTNYDDSYATPVLTAGQSFILGYTNEEDNHYKASREHPVIIFDDFTTAMQWVDFEFKVKSSAMKMLVPKDVPKAVLRYIYYAMQCIRYVPVDHSRHWIEKYSKFTIPVPPIEIQHEIVQTLDNFTQLTAELSAELEARRKQYEYYRDKLLSFSDDDSNVEWKKLGDVCHYPKERVSFNALNSNQYVGVENLLQNRMGVKFGASLPKSGYAIKFNSGDVLIGNIRPYLRKLWLADRDGGTNGDVVLLRSNDSDLLSPRFLYHLMASEKFFIYDIQYSVGAKMPRGNRDAILQFLIPLPPLESQKRIVAILDKFDLLCNDRTAGLPAEIEARRKQYEYYRERLLTFKKKED